MRTVFLGMGVFWGLVGVVLGLATWFQAYPPVMGYVSGTFILIGIAAALGSRKM